jgi:hypothetical protein
MVAKSKHINNNQNIAILQTDEGRNIRQRNKKANVEPHDLHIERMSEMLNSRNF